MAERIKTNGNGHNKMTTGEWASAITASWQKAVESIVATGRLLIEARDGLRGQRGAWGEMVEKLPFSWRTADYLMAIAQHPVLGDSQFIANLPPSWGTLGDLSALPAPAVKELIADGRIKADMTRADAAEIIREHREEGLYRFERVPEALTTFIKLMRKWPDPAVIAERVFDAMVEEGHELDLDDVGKLPGWLGNLYGACRALDREENETLTIVPEPTTEAELKREKRERKPKAEDKRARFAFGARPSGEAPPPSKVGNGAGGRM